MNNKEEFAKVITKFCVENRIKIKAMDAKIKAQEEVIQKLVEEVMLNREALYETIVNMRGDKLGKDNRKLN